MKAKSLLTLVGILFLFIAKSQTAPSFTGGTRQNLAICQNSGTNVIDSKMVTSDPDPSQTLTYTIASAPIHGTVHGFPGLTSTGAGGIISPVGFDYAPANGYNGLDSFIVNVNDGTLFGQTKIVVTINALPTVAATTGTAATCIGSTSQLSNTTPNGVWSSNNIFVADISNTGLVTGQAAGTAIISYTVTDAITGCSNVATTNFIVGGYPVVQPITGTTTVCVGNTTQLASATTGGVWSSGNVTRATVNASTGLVTGVGSGNVTITYTVTNAAGCATAVTTNVAVNAKPNIGTITANTTTICVGSTTNLTIGSAGGTWSSSNTAIATVTNGGGGGGTVTGVAAGSVYISYTITNANGCTAKDSVQITITNGVTVAPITGPTSVCVGKTITLSNTTSGGTWSITPGFRASINASGVLTGNTAGNATVTYSVTSGGCTKSVTYIVAVNNAPTLAAITGSNQVCVGLTTTLSNSTTGGVWSSSNTSIATVLNTGVVTGVAAGNDTIKYKVTNAAGCVDSVTFAMSVTSAITVNPINGASSVCLGSTLQLTNTTPGGVWASSDNSIAFVTGAGLVIPVAQGVVAITYTVGTGACSGVASKNVIVNPSPTVDAISGNTAICRGTTSQLSTTTTGGIWASGNNTVATVNSTGLVTPSIAGPNGASTSISYTVTNSYGCTSLASVNITVNNVTTVNAITGVNSTCVGSTTTLNSTTTGGVWSHTNPTVTQLVPVNNNAVINGLSVGTDTISYSLTNGNGCTTTVTKIMTVAAALTVAPIVGSATMCFAAGGGGGGQTTVTYTCATTGGYWTSSNTGVATINCGNTSFCTPAQNPAGQATPVAAGTTTITYTLDNGIGCVASSTLNITVANRPTLPTISGATSVCVSDSTKLTGTSTPAGLSGFWTSQNANLVKIDSLTGWAKGITAFNPPIPSQTNITYTVTNAAGCTRTSANYTMTVNAGPTISQITPNGGVNVCVGATSTLANATTGGKWRSSNTAIATIDSLNGVVTGVGAGNVVISYIVTNATGCASSASKFVTVNATPTVATTTGANTVCVSSSTTLINATNGGTWTSSNTAVATVVNGVVTGVGAGTCNIVYTVTNGGGPGGGCSASSTTAFTVNAVPTVTPIIVPTGTTRVCVGNTVQLSNTTSGGVWGISNVNRATVSNTGLVTGVSAGAIIVTYTVVGTGCSATAFANGTVYALPTVAAIAGSSAVCTGSTITLTNDTTGGVWSASNGNAAISSTGVVTGVIAGLDTISYTKTNSNGCIKTVTKIITINALPTINPTTGTTSLCVGAITTLSNTTLGGTWSSANTSVATVNSSGVVSGVSAGIVAIKYIVTNGSGCTDSVSTNVTVNALPLVATIGGNSSACVGSTTTLTNATTGGVWSSSNTAVATITAGGVVSGLTAGTTTIKYQVTNASNCIDSVTITFTVNALPTVAAITGNTPVCVGSTRALANTTVGGVWSSSNTTIATVNASGVVLGISAGISIIKYQVTNASGCIDSATTTITVNALPTVAALTGTNTVCVGLTTTYSSTTTGGVWSTSNATIATVVNGVITGVAAGTATISYAVTNVDGCTKTVTKTVTVNALPTVAAITGSSSVCIGSTTTYSSTPTTGVWTSDNTTVATVGSTTGIVTGVSAGTATITYTVSNANGCIKSVTKIITVNALPTAAFTINNNTQCVNTNSFVFTNTSVGAANSLWNFGDATTSTTTSPTKTYATAGTYNVKLVVTNSNGCKDSVTQSVTVKPTSTSTTNISICPSELPYTWNSLTFTAAGSQTAHLTNSVGCDSAATLNLTVKANTSSTTNISICPVDLPYTWNGLTFTAAGSQTAHLTNAAGCDSAATLNLTVKANTSSTTNTSICPSALPYTWNSLTFTAAGTQTAHLTNAAGCDSAATLNLIVKATSNSTTNTSICPIDLPYTWNGLTFTAAGSQTAHLTNSVGCDSAATLNLTVKATSTSTTNISICPSALPYTWNSLTFTAAGSQTAHLTNSVGCDSAATLNLTVKANTTSTTNTSICPIDLPYTWNGLTFTAAGSQTAHLTNSVGCDSAATLNLTLKANTSSTTNISICPVDLPYTWNGLTFTVAGSQTAHLTNAAGCDSAATLNLTVKATSVSSTTFTACNTYTWNGTTYTTSGDYIYHTLNSVGCDSAATLHLTINYSTTSSTSVTNCDSYVWNGVTYTASGDYTVHFTNVANCDSAATLHLTINHSTTSSTSITNCDSYVWNGVTYTASGDYTVHFTNAANCDSAATLHLTINHSTTSSTSITNCDSYVWNGVTYTASGDYTVHFTNAANCDSAATLHLTINHSTTSSTSITNCDSYVWNGTTYTASGNYTVHFTNAANCDSAATLVLTINHSSTSSTPITACDSYVWNGTTYTASGNYTEHFTNSVNCDSAATLHLTINHSTTSSTSITNCDSYVWNGVTYTASGDYTVHFTNAANCDSAATLHLTINHSTTSSTSITNCDSYVWNGVTYTASGNYTVHFTNAANCDSAATLHLTINHSTTSSTSITNCDNYVWNGVTYTASGDYTVHFTNVANCDSAATLHLTINHSTTSSTSITNCDSYVWNGVTYTASGDYTVHFTNAANCDSAATLHLTINHSTTSSTSITNCDSYVWNGTTYTASGDYTVHFTNSVNCDSAATLVLTINHSNTSTSKDTICSSQLPYTWNGLTFTAAGSQTYHTLNSVGCDSAATLVLTVNANPVVPAINGTPMVCVGNTTPLSNTTAGGVWASLDNAVATIDASGVVTGVSAGTSLISYTVTNANNCTSIASINVMVNALPTVAAITGSNQVCIGSTTTLSNTTLGGVWSSLTPATATITNTGVVTGVSVGGTTIKYTVTDANGCSTTVNHIMTVNALPTVAAITGTTTVCVGSSSILSNTTTGGTWASSNTAVATIDANTGFLTGIANGVAIITYTVTDVITGCSNSTSTTVTVNSLPVIASINGASQVCLGSNATYSSATLGGIWSSTNTSIATINASTGVLTTVAAGTTRIFYLITNSNGCTDSVYKDIIVNDVPMVTPIVGMNTACAGSTLNYTNATSGGVWASVNNNIATVSSTGLVNAIAAGVDTITYTVTNGANCSTMVSQILSVSTPAVAPITGVNSICPTNTSMLSTTTTGGVWSSSDVAVATVDANTGLVTAIANGTTTISYTIPVGNACGNSASIVVTVSSNTTITATTGDTTVCLGVNSKLINSTLGGVWSSSNTAVATVDNNGNVTSVGAGTTTIKYVVIAGCIADSASVTFTVSANPTKPTITAPSALCVGSTAMATSITSGGVWSSSDNTIASIDNAGSINAIAVGSANIIYTVTNSSNCSSSDTTSITINGLPNVNAIAGANAVCLGSSITLTNDSTGGVWSSNNTAVLSIDASGVITTVAAGNTTVDYTITNANGCSNKASKTITVFGLPTIAAITGGNSVCVGSSITLSSTTPNGVWSSVTPFVASITNAGVVTGNVAGGTTIKYTVTDAATTCINNASMVVTVNALPNVSAITGANSVCLNNTTTLSNATASGTWSSSNTSVATIDNAGVVTGVGAGNATITYSVTNASNCSANVTSSITVNVATTSSTPISVCNNMLPYNWNGNNYNAAGTYTYTTTNANGCDSVATLVLTVKDTTTSSTSITNCDSYVWNGITYTTSGTYTWKGTNAAGCDSIATLILTINNGTHNVTTQTACDTYTWNGTSYTASGMYTYSYNNTNGCASVDTLILTINNGTHNATTQTACNSLAWNGTTYTTSGTYTYNYNNTNGCASVDTLYLTINTGTHNVSTQTACDTYTWNGTVYTTSGTYTYSYNNTNGCASVDTLILTINNGTHNVTTQTACDSYTWNGTAYTTSGMYTYSYNNSNGCASVDTLILTINISPATPIITTSTINVTVPATGIAYGCSTVSGATSYTWSYTGTGVTIATGQGTENITADFAANATNGNMQVVANNGTCSSTPATVTLVLPITLSNFTATKVNNTALLKWNSKIEINAKEYQVQRSVDGRTYETIGTVAAKGFASDYTFVDEKPYAGVNYYRLKQVDKDGKFEYSDVRNLNFKSQTLNVSIYPNPATNILNVKAENATQIRIFDANGKSVYKTIVNGQPLSINVQPFAKGTYFVEVITTDGNRQVEKLIKE